MSKKILFLIIFCSVVLFFPIKNISATQVYVGVKISSATTPGSYTIHDASGNVVETLSDTNWCLPIDTEMAIITSNNETCESDYSLSDVCNNGHCGDWNSVYHFDCISVSGNLYTTTTQPTCPGETIWSKLVNISSGSSYGIVIHTPSFCPGYYDAVYSQVCWVAPENKNCCDACLDYGLSVFGYESSHGTWGNIGDYCYESDYCVDAYSSGYVCGAHAALMGSPCSTCEAAEGVYNYYNPTTKQCYYRSSGNSQCDLAPGVGLNRVCRCYMPNYTNTSSNFFIPFTASF